MCDYSTLPEGLQGGMQRYLEHGILPGHFLTAVLKNNLFDAVMRADANNLKELPSIVRWIHNEARGDSHGSIVKVVDWVNTFKSVEERKDI